MGGASHCPLLEVLRLGDRDVNTEQHLAEKSTKEVLPQSASSLGLLQDLQDAGMRKLFLVALLNYHCHKCTKKSILIGGKDD